MLFSVRNTFSKDDFGWKDYLDFIQFKVPDVIYTFDGALNDPVDNTAVRIDSVQDLEEAKKVLPDLTEPETQYYQMAINLDEEAMPELPSHITILGYDICDDTEVSSLLNCGPWEDELAPIAARINQYGLLSLEDAQEAKRLIPQLWDDNDEEPRGSDVIWCVCKVA